MNDAVRYLLPAIPTVLYAGLGRHQVERLVVMRSMGELVWARYAQGRDLTVDFDSFFQEVVAQFDMSGEEFSVPRVQDELVGEMSALFGVSYDLIMFELTEPDVRQHALRTALAVPMTPPTLPVPEAPPPFQVPMPETGSTRPMSANLTAASRTPQPDVATPSQTLAEKTPATDVLQAHIVSPAQTTERLQSIQKLVADQLDEETPPDFETSFRITETPIGALLCGAESHPIPRLSDEALVKLFRLIRLARRLFDLEATISSD